MVHKRKGVAKKVLARVFMRTVILGKTVMSHASGEGTGTVGKDGSRHGFWAWQKTSEDCNGLRSLIKFGIVGQQALLFTFCDCNSSMRPNAC